MQACEDQILETLALHTLGGVACSALIPPPAAANPHATFVREATWRTAALEALHSWLTHYVASLPQRQQESLSGQAGLALAPLLSLISSPDSPLPKDVAATAPEARHALRALQHGVLRALLCMPGVGALRAQAPEATAACLTPLRDGRPWLTAHTRRAVHSRLLRPLLNPQDTATAPYLRCCDDGFAMVCYSHPHLLPATVQVAKGLYRYMCDPLVQFYQHGSSCLPVWPLSLAPRCTRGVRIGPLGPA